jgi:hypothetical protein
VRRKLEKIDIMSSHLSYSEYDGEVKEEEEGEGEEKAKIRW